MKKRTSPRVYDFTRPIHILEYKNPGLDIMFYSAGLSVAVAAVFFLCCFHAGRVALHFTLPRVLISFPLVLTAALFGSLLKELNTYPKLLLKKSRWTLEEMMRMTHKNARDTERIMTRVLESCFIVDENSIKNV